MMTRRATNLYCFIVVLQLFFTTALSRRRTAASSGVDGGGGQWQLLQQSIGISAMHMQLLHNDRVVIFDRTDFGQSNLSLPDGQCRSDPDDTALELDCTAHSVEYDIATNTFRPLMVQTDVWCSSGAVTADGTLIQTGGFNDGERRVRVFIPCSDRVCDWKEIENGLAARRWYATNQNLPDGRQIVIGGRRQFNYEYYPKTGAPTVYSLRFLVETNDRGMENNLYPFVHLNVDGNLFIFANNRAILFDYVNNKVVRTFPAIPGGDPRSYPSTGSSVLLPIRNLEAATIEAEVLVCGGGPKGSFLSANKSTFVPALDTCGRIKVTEPNPQWVMETMPQGRTMGDMVLLPNGHVLIINGAGAGTAGWENGRDPVLTPVIYRPDSPVGARFEVKNPSGVPRMYHSTAILLRDGRVLVGGSNPHIYYNFTGVLFPTELSLEAFSPPYLDAQFAFLRPKILAPSSQTKLRHGQAFTVQFSLTGPFNATAVAVTMVSPPFTTHSFSMNQRLLVIGGGSAAADGPSTYAVSVTVPGSGILAPSGFYLLFVVHQETPSDGIWVQI